MLAARLLLAAAIASPLPALPQPPAIEWSNVVEQPNFKVDIDPKSVKMVVRANGFEMHTKLRMDFGKPFIVPDKTKLGAYYVNDVVVKCRDDTFNIQRSTVFSADGEQLATGVDVASIKNPKNPKSFISVWITLACSQFKGKRPPVVI